MRVDTLDEAIELINRSTYANGTAIFTGSGQAARKFQREIQVGMIGVNVPIPVPMAFYSFGGWKDSLFGDHHIHGPEGVKFYTRAKVVTTRWPEDAQDSSHHRGHMHFPTARLEQEERTMKIALDPYMFRHVPLLELPALVADLGYEYIELSPRPDFIPFFRAPAGGPGDDRGVPARARTPRASRSPRSCRSITGRARTRRSARTPSATGSARSRSPSSSASTR